MLSLSLGHWLPLLFDIALKSALVSALALAALIALRRAPAATRHLALLAGLGVLLGLPALMLLLPRQALPRPAGAPRAAVIAAPALPMPAPVEAATAPPVSASPALSAAASSLLPPSVPAPVQAPVPASAPPPPVRPTWLVAAWLLGVLTCAGRMLAAQARVWRLTRRCPPLSLSAPAPSGFAALKGGPAGTPPMVWGWPRATLLLPPASSIWPAARLRAVLLHEAAHVRRQDWLTQTLTQAACALYWFNPLVWLLAARLQSEAERAADDAVLLAGVPPADYASDLLAVAHALSTSGRQRRASLAAVTMARRSSVRGRLEAILDARRPRRRLTRRSAAFAFAVALAVAAPLAALRPAARADEAPAGQAAPAPGVPTEADLARVQRHLQSLEEARAEYGAAHPNTLTAAQIAAVDRLIELTEFKHASARFKAQEAADNKRLRAEARKPHTKREREQIWGPIFAYEHTDPIVAKRERAEALRFDLLANEVAALPEPQRTRETKLYAWDKADAVDKTQMDVMQMEKSLGYSLHVDVPAEADSGFSMEKRGWMSRADWVHVILLERKMGKRKRLTDADIDSLAAILRERPKAPSVAPVTVMTVLRELADLSPAQRQKIWQAVSPFLTSLSKWDRISAQRVLRKFGASMPTPPPAQKAQAAPAAPRQITPQTTQAGVSPMTPRIILKPMLLRMAAFTALAALTPPAAHAAPPAPAPKPTAPALAASGLHWDTVALQHTTIRAIIDSLHWGHGMPNPDGVKRLYYMMGNNTVLVQATPAGLAHTRGLIAALDVAPLNVAPQPVQIRVTFAPITEADLYALSPRFYEIPLDSQGAMVKSLRVFRPGTGDSAVAAFLAAPANREAVVVAPVATTDVNVAAAINIEGAPLVPGSRSAQLVITPRIDKAGFLTLQMVVPSLLPAGAGGNAPPPVQILRPVSSGTPVVLVDSLPPAAGGGNRYLLICVTPTEVAGPNPAR